MANGTAPVLSLEIIALLPQPCAEAVFSWVSLPLGAACGGDGDVSGAAVLPLQRLSLGKLQSPSYTASFLSRNGKRSLSPSLANPLMDVMVSGCSAFSSSLQSLPHSSVKLGSGFQAEAMAAASV